MKKHFKVAISTIILLSGLQSGCGNNRDAIAMAAVAGSLAVIQIARTDYSKPLPECNEFCGVCETPCGDLCVPIGTPCAAPLGSACKYSKVPVNSSVPGAFETFSGHCQGNVLPSF